MSRKVKQSKEVEQITDEVRYERLKWLKDLGFHLDVRQWAFFKEYEANQARKAYKDE